MTDSILHAQDTWPRRKNGEVILNSTADARTFAQLVKNTPYAYALLDHWRTNLIQRANRLQSKNHFDLDFLIRLVVRAQLYRECMEEIQRLNKEEL